MKTTASLLGSLGAGLLLSVSPAAAQAPAGPPPAPAAAPTTFTITVQRPENGTIAISPELPADGKVAPGTEFTVTATPAPGFAIDSVYYSIPGRFAGFEEYTGTQIKVTADRNKSVGASFIDPKALEGFTVKQNIVYAKPGNKTLKYDVFTPNGARNLPAIVIIHGGGWAANTEDIMRGLARELVRDGKYVVASVDYRWIGTSDGDKTPNPMSALVEDVFGALAHFQEHAASYGADPTRLAVTGDSAGGHLSAAAINLVDMIGDGGFGVKEGVYQFKPTYLPAGKTAAQVRASLTAAIKAAAPSYGVFSPTMLAGQMAGAPTEAVAAIAPQAHIPNIKDRAVPQYLLRGTNDRTIPDAEVQGYTDALKAAGQRAEYVLVEGAGHAFFDWKPQNGVKATFARYGVKYAAEMEAFFNSIFYPAAK
jgi:acetyl esterase